MDERREWTERKNKKGMSQRDIVETIEDIYGFEASRKLFQLLSLKLSINDASSIRCAIP